MDKLFSKVMILRSCKTMPRPSTSFQILRSILTPPLLSFFACNLFLLSSALFREHLGLLPTRRHSMWLIKKHSKKVFHLIWSSIWEHGSSSSLTLSLFHLWSLLSSSSFGKQCLWPQIIWCLMRSRTWKWELNRLISTNNLGRLSTYSPTRQVPWHAMSWSSKNFRQEGDHMDLMKSHLQMKSKRAMYVSTTHL